MKPIPGTDRLPLWISDTLRMYGKTREKPFVRESLRKNRLFTVCEEAFCPNRPHCFSRSTAAFMILGGICTRTCGFCSVEKGTPSPAGHDEPIRIADAVAEIGLRYVVITSVTRDDLPDGGAGHFAAVVRELRKRCPDIRIETLIPDFRGAPESLQKVLETCPDVLNHNLETVSRLYPSVRPQAEYGRSMTLLRRAKDSGNALFIKSGFMLGLGETQSETIALLADLKKAGCDIVTIGQYLRPSKKHLPVVEYIPPEVFDSLRQQAEGMGFASVFSGPLVRSSMHAEECFRITEKKAC